MKKLFLFSAFLLLFSGAVSFPAPRASAEEGVSENIPATSSFYPELQLLIQEALEEYPSLKRHDALKESYLAQKRVVSQWQDPKLHLGLNNLPTNGMNFSQEGMTSKSFGISQFIDAPGKREKRAEVFGYSAKRELALKGEERAHITMAISSDYFRLLFFRTQKEILLESDTVLKRFIEIARQKYRLGKGNQTDILEAEIERSRIQEKLLKLEEQIATFRYRLGQYVRRPEGVDPKAVSSFFYSALQLSRQEVVEKAKQHNPLLLTAREALREAKAKRELSELNPSPDYTISARYAQRDATASGINRSDLFSLNLSFPLSFLDTGKRADELREAAKRETGAQLRIEELKRRIGAMASSRFDQLKKNQEQVELYAHDIIPQRSQSLRSAFGNYQTDRIDFLFLLSIEIGLFKDKLTLVENVMKHEIQMIELEELTGKPLEVQKHLLPEWNDEI